MASMLERISDRLTDLLKQEPDPQAKMRQVDVRMTEAGLWEGNSPDPDLAPWAFFDQRIVENPLMQVHVQGLVMGSDPENAESVDELLASLGVE